MCEFFSFLSNPETGKYYYFNAEQRISILHGKLKRKEYEADSHSSIATFHGFESQRQDELNSYEYDFINKVLKTDTLFGKNDVNAARRFAETLDFTTIIPYYNGNKFINPETIVRKLSAKDKSNFKKWVQIVETWNKKHRKADIDDMIFDKLRKTSDEDCVNKFYSNISVHSKYGKGSGRYSFVYAYISSLFDIDFGIDFSCVAELWKRGFLAYRHEEMWYLESAKEQEVVYELKGE